MGGRKSLTYEEQLDLNQAKKSFLLDQLSSSREWKEITINGQDWIVDLHKGTDSVHLFYGAGRVG